MDPNNKHEVNHLFLYACALSALLIGTGWLLLILSNSFWTIAFLIAILLLMPAIPFKRKFKPINLCIALIILIHLLIAPFVYVWALQNDSTSFVVDQQIIKNERTSYLQEIDELRKKENSDFTLKLINTIFATHSKNLDISTDFLNDNVIRVDTFTFSYFPVDMGIGWLKIYDNTGKKIDDLGGTDFMTGESFTLTPSPSYSLKNYLVFYKNHLTKKDQEYNHKKQLARKNDIWTYSHVLPYVLDVYDTANFKPITRTAQIIHAVHVVVVFILLFGFLGTLLYEMVIKRFKHTQRL